MPPDDPIERHRVRIAAALEYLQIYYNRAEMAWHEQDFKAVREHAWDIRRTAHDLEYGITGLLTELNAQKKEEEPCSG